MIGNETQKGEMTSSINQHLQVPKKSPGNFKSMKSKDYGVLIGAAEATANIDEFMKMLVSIITSDNSKS